MITCIEDIKEYGDHYQKTQCKWCDRVFDSFFITGSMVISYDFWCIYCKLKRHRLEGALDKLGVFDELYYL